MIYASVPQNQRGKVRLCRNSDRNISKGIEKQREINSETSFAELVWRARKGYSDHVAIANSTVITTCKIGRRYHVQLEKVCLIGTQLYHQGAVDIKGFRTKRVAIAHGIKLLGVCHAPAA